MMSKLQQKLNDSDIQAKLAKKEHTFAKRLRRIHRKNNTQHLTILHQETQGFLENVKLFIQLKEVCANDLLKKMAIYSELELFTNSLESILFKTATTYQDGQNAQFFVSKKIYRSTSKLLGSFKRF